jgi:hypothetical protein
MHQMLLPVATRMFFAGMAPFHPDDGTFSSGISLFHPDDGLFPPEYHFFIRTMALFHPERHFFIRTTAFFIRTIPLTAPRHDGIPCSAIKG